MLIPQERRQSKEERERQRLEMTPEACANTPEPYLTTRERWQGGRNGLWTTPNPNPNPVSPYNVLVYLTAINAFRELRSLVVEMVLATDMSCHFEQIKVMKGLLQQPDS